MQAQSFRRELTQKCFKDLINPDHFDPRYEEVESGKMYRIPLHQRFPGWKKTLKDRFINSVCRGYPTGTILVSRHFCTKHGGDPIEYFNIQDGQTRMTVMQEYTLDNFACAIDKHGKEELKFSELSQDLQLKIKNYQVTVETLYNATDDDISEIFCRANAGKPLTSNDKFHARKNTPVMTGIIDISQTPTFLGWFKKYIGPTRSGKIRGFLGDITGAVLSIAMDSLEYLTTSYEKNYMHLSIEFNEHQRVSITTFLEFYFTMLDRVFENCPVKKNCVINCHPCWDYHVVHGSLEGKLFRPFLGIPNSFFEIQLIDHLPLMNLLTEN